MKMNKFFMLGLAGLAFAACSNEEDVTDKGPQFTGNGAVSVRIVKPTMNQRNAGGATSGKDGDKVSLEGDLTVTLTGAGGYNESITIGADKIDASTVLKFWNVQAPEKLTVSINGGVADYSTVDLTTLQMPAANVPAYGETSTFTLTDKADSPVTANNGKTEAGADADDAETVYQMYEATVTMAIPLARLEVSNIAHITHAGAPDNVCKFTKLIANAAYLDGFTTKGSVYANGAFPASDGAAGDYCYDGNGTGGEATLVDKIGEDAGQDFMNAATLAGPFTYNFYANGINPLFKLFFGTAEGTNIISPRYAMITKYKKENAEGGYDDVTFENGKIYRITKAELKDSNIIGDEGGNTLYGVEVTVEEAQWTVVDIESDWAE